MVFHKGQPLPVAHPSPAFATCGCSALETVGRKPAPVPQCGHPTAGGCLQLGAEWGCAPSPRPLPAVFPRALRAFVCLAGWILRPLDNIVGSLMLDESHLKVRATCEGTFVSPEQQHSWFLEETVCKSDRTARSLLSPRCTSGRRGAPSTWCGRRSCRLQAG